MTRNGPGGRGLSHTRGTRSCSETSCAGFIAYAVDGAYRMQRLINDLLAYSRVGTRGKEFEPTDCSAFFDQALANLKVTIEESGAVVDRGPSTNRDGR